MDQRLLFSLADQFSLSTVQTLSLTACAFVAGSLFLYHIYQKKVYRNNTEASLKKIERNRSPKF